MNKRHILQRGFQRALGKDKYANGEIQSGWMGKITENCTGAREKGSYFVTNLAFRNKGDL